MSTWSLTGTRTTGVAGYPFIAWSRLVVICRSMGECSASMSTHCIPEAAAISAATGEPEQTHIPARCSPAPSFATRWVKVCGSST